MHPDADAFLDAIFDHPDDDTARLVYADWLEEHGQASYAQFIRFQCAVAREELWSAEANRLWEEIGRVWSTLHSDWWPATTDVWYLPKLIEVWDSYRNTLVSRRELEPGLLDATHFHRGLLRPEIPLSSQQVLRYSAFWPSIMTADASLTIEEPDAALISADQVLRHVRVIRFAVDWYEDDYSRASQSLCTFLRSPNLSGVRTLDMTDMYLDSSTIDTILSTPTLSGVDEIRLHHFQNSHFDSEEILERFRARFKNVVRHE